MALGKVSRFVPNRRCKFRKGLVQSRSSGKALDHSPGEVAENPDPDPADAQTVPDAYTHNLAGSGGRAMAWAGTGSDGLT